MSLAGSAASKTGDDEIGADTLEQFAAISGVLGSGERRVRGMSFGPYLGKERAVCAE